MKVLIDATGIAKVKAGVGVYARNLLDELTNELIGSRAGLQFFILAQNDDPEMDFSARAGVTMIWVSARFFRILPLRFLLEQVYLPFLLLSRRIDVLHSLHYALPLISFGTRRVVTFHDMTFFRMPELHERLKVLYFRAFMRAAVRFADHIIFISRSAMQDCAATLGPPRGNASVIPHGKGGAFRPGISPVVVDAARKKYRLGERFVLYIGTIEPRKNLPRLVEAFARLAAEDAGIQLVIAGKMGWKNEALLRVIEKFDLSSRIVFPGFVAEEDKAALLSACTIFVYPSLYEGFGLPALEAIACGAPTITSNTSSLPEVVGDAALLVDPANTEALTSAMQALLSTPALRDDLRRRGPEQAASFTWERTAALTVDVYRSFASAKLK